MSYYFRDGNFRQDYQENVLTSVSYNNRTHNLIATDYDGPVQVVVVRKENDEQVCSLFFNEKWLRNFTKQDCQKILALFS